MGMMMARGWRRLAPLLTVLAWMHAMPEAVGGGSDALFPDGHENVTFLTDANFYQHVTSDARWVVNFYSPMCSHCRQFAPAFVEVAAHYKAVVGGRIRVGAVNCLDNVLCRRFEIHGYPQIVFYNFGEVGETRRRRGGSGPSTIYATVQELLDAATEQPAPSSEAKDSDVADVAMSTHVRPYWTASSGPTTRESRLQDAASAIVYGLKHELFAASEGNLSPVELAALKQWLWLHQRTFPGPHHRAALKVLHDDVSSLDHLDMVTWHNLLHAWQDESVAAPAAAADETPVWMDLHGLFQTDGKSYKRCHSYTCGLWTVIHIAAHQTTALSPNDCVQVYQAIRGFVATFMTCDACREHFVAVNPLTLQTKSPVALQLWAYNMHSAVNARVHHPVFPSPSDCPRCATDTRAVLRFLDSMYAYPEPTALRASDSSWVVYVGVGAGVAGVGSVVAMVWWRQSSARPLPRFQKNRVA
ncbi:hypothetical protein H310_10715 [Aphanomyces invadans]|uniref:Sulfhydryl oxidase n=1 Tax=Aphanomyces invadans TaxID=157072 RepID=A0A024TPX1_9STRA|nr:hypothetical protein H310_10715 [Aphanomyces invadans]ETV96073.1 hypothetical protein H310_10715 [Aphanomyces invadans]|eukprot:XP_008875384.1 hypothetical protein H310_10715 [Aphanomyces invadans]